jgi:clan AA aspartic protease (TIGR02281 family)
MRRSFLLLAAALAAAPARADTVELTSGKTMSGLITRETRTELDLDFGYGTVTLNKSDVARIKRSSTKNRASLEKARRLKSLEEGETPPPEGGAPLLEAYKKAAQARQDLRDARAQAARVGDADAGGDPELTELIADNKRVAEELQGADARADPGNYNRLIREFNGGTAAIRAKQLDLVERRSSSASAIEKSRDYLSAYQDFAREFRGAPAPDESAGADEREFHALMKDALAAMDRDFSREKVEAERRGSHWIVPVVLDGKVNARLLLDTGASMVVISRSIAAQLGPEAKKAGATTVTVADGRTVPTDVLELPSVEVGLNRADKVLAAIMPDAPQGDIDGLLGMTFLNRFGFESDPKSGVFYLRRLK